MKPARRLPWLEIAIWSGAAAAVSACLVILVDAGPGVSAGLVILVLLAAAGLRLYFAGDHNVGGGLFVTAVVSGVVVLVQMEADRRQAEQDAHRERLQNRSDERERRLVERQTLAVTLGQSRELPGIDLSGRDLSGFYLAGKRLNGARLAGARLDKANLAGIDLRRADLSDAKLKGADLVAADLSGADLTGADLRSANLAFADMRGANLANATLRGANLNAADLRSAVDQQFSSPGDLFLSFFYGALQTELAGADLTQAKLVDADLSDASLQGAKLRGADLRSARLRGVNARGADFTNADLRAARMDDFGDGFAMGDFGGHATRVRRALAGDLATASAVTRSMMFYSGRDVDLVDAELADARFEGARAHESTRWPDGVRPRGIRVE